MLPNRPQHVYGQLPCPPALSEAGQKELNCLKGSIVSIIVAKYPQKKAHWKVSGGCRIAKYMEPLLEVISAVQLVILFRLCYYTSV